MQQLQLCLRSSHKALCLAKWRYSDGAHSAPNDSLVTELFILGRTAPPLLQVSLITDHSLLSIHRTTFLTLSLTLSRLNKVFPLSDMWVECSKPNYDISVQHSSVLYLNHRSFQSAVLVKHVERHNSGTFDMIDNSITDCRYCRIPVSTINKRSVLSAGRNVALIARSARLII